MFRLVVLLSVVCVMVLHGSPSVDSQGARKGVWSSDYPAVTAAAQADKSCVFVLFTGSDWCVWCKLMDEKVFSTEAWRQFASGRLYLAYIDFPRDSSGVPEAVHNQNVRLQEEFNVDGYPTMLLLDSDGNRLASFHAGKDITAAQFISEVRRALLLSPAELERVYLTMPASRALAVKANAEKYNALRRRREQNEQEFAAAQRKYMEADAAINAELSRMQAPDTQIMEYLLETRKPDAFKKYQEIAQEQKKRRTEAENALRRLMENPEHTDAEVQKLLEAAAADEREAERQKQLLFDQIYQ